MRSSFFCFAVCASFFACDAPPAAPAAPAAVVPAGAVGDVLKGYEALRVALADDRVDAALVSALATSAAALGDKAGAADVVAGAKALGEAGADLEKARVAYGEVSKGVVALIAADASLQAGRFLFECPMAKGYQRWVQVTPTMANPYMGKRMLECGVDVKPWKVTG